jgi:ABC-type multidrug transport system fused ATPase/permease subunit
VAFGGIILLILYLMTLKGNFINSIPIISLYVFAGYRLMPALQQIYRSLIQIRYSGPAVDLLTNNLKNLNSPKVNQYTDSLKLNKCIELKNINFTYPNSSRKALEDVSMIIPAKSFIGLIGSTGSGKTTIVDIILGLLDPQKGHLEVDGTRINRENIQAWQRSIGYVPQHIYLSDDTVAANIAFGVETENINYDDIERASRIANLHEFVANELPNQYQTEVGERGVRLSGGQRQRIGIARALYHNPEVLILDEATSALDNLTERAVMEAVNNLNDNITVIIIAHRLTTVKKCDKIFHLEKGKLKSQDNFENMKIKNSLFI